MSMTAWEYFQITLDDGDMGELDALGKAGWEMVSAMRVTWTDRKECLQVNFIYVFKRPLPSRKRDK